MEVLLHFIRDRDRDPGLVTLPSMGNASIVECCNSLSNNAYGCHDLVQ